MAVILHNLFHSFAKVEIQLIFEQGVKKVSLSMSEAYLEPSQTLKMSFYQK